MWKSTIDDRELEFYLVGINNQNFIMADRQTGSWWQQVTGEAIRGPLNGRRLEMMPFEQLTWGVWRAEHPGTRVLESRAEFEDDYWNELESDYRDGEGMPFVTERDPDDPLEPGDLVVAVVLERGQKAYPMKLLAEQSPLTDEVDGRPLLVVVGGDGRSVRCFDRSLDGQALDLYLRPRSDELMLVDAATGSEFDFSGTAVNGPLAGRRLGRVQVYTDYWFDWKSFHPDGPVYTAGLGGR